MDITKIAKKMLQAKTLRSEAAVANALALKVESEARELCPHTDTFTEEDYWGGSYLDQATSTVRTYCALCKKQLDSTVKQLGYFG